MQSRPFLIALLLLLPIGAMRAQSTPGQAIDQEYTRLIREYLQDPRITTELVDHLPASDHVPSPLKFLGRIVGTPGELTYAKDIQRYYEALAQASPRAHFWKIGTTEEGRDIVALAVADEATIASLDRYKSMLGALTDPRTTSDADAAQLVTTAKPVYYVVSGMHSPETGGPEMLLELAYRLIVEETPFIQNIRNNVITIITPVLEVDGREKQVDTYRFNKTRARGDARLPLIYWGKYVAHDNNRDGMGQYLKLTQAVTQLTLEWHPTITHDLHEAQTYLYASTGTGPYNDALDPITISEWWTLAENDVLEMTKRSVPGVWTYGYYDGWVPNYMIFIAHSHNAVGRFYEVQGYGPDTSEVRPNATALSREWFRPNPPLSFIKWGPRNNTNIQESALLFSLGHVAKNRQSYLENYWLKNKRAVEKGKNGPVYAWVIPADQRRKADTATAVNDLRRQGLEISRAAAAFDMGSLKVHAGDFVVRGDQPFRTVADMYFSIQNYPPQNPAPYDDTGWTFQLMRDLRIVPISDRSVLDKPMTKITADVHVPGGISGAGSTLVVDDTGDNGLVTFRFRHPNVKMLAAEQDFDVQADGARRKLRAGSLIIEHADRPSLETDLRALGLSAWAVSSPPTVRTHELDVPRIGYVHSWIRTQDEGWWRAAFDAYGVPYTYFSDQKLRDGNLRSKYDVIVMPHIGGSAISQVNGVAKTGSAPLPYKRTPETPNLGVLDSSDDIRGGMEVEGLAKLVEFVRQGGLLITEGSTATIFPEYGITSSVTVEEPSQLFARGSILRSTIADASSPIVYGYDPEVPVYFNQSPVLSVGGNRGNAPTGSGGFGQNITPNATPLRITPFEPEPSDASDQPAQRTRTTPPERPRAEDVDRVAQQTGGPSPARPRVVMQFATDPGQLLLSGTLAGGQALAGRAAAIDEKIGNGHIVLFAIRPFWRWQTQGTFGLGFNAIMNWNDLDAGK
jgi:zinc carboxypeptidase